MLACLGEGVLAAIFLPSWRAGAACDVWSANADTPEWGEVGKRKKILFPGITASGK